MLTKLVPNFLFTFDQQQANRTSTNPQPLNQPTNFFQVENRNYKLRQHTIAHGGLNPNPVVAGTHAHPQRNFKWLPWILGKVSYVPLNNNEIVITGEMSGCWLLIFDLNGQRCFGHIGTYLSSNDPNTLDAINAWKIAVRSGKVTLILGFNPVTVGMPTQKTFGAVDGNGRQLYTIGLDKVQTPIPGVAYPWKVVHVTPTAGQPLPRPPY